MSESNGNGTNGAAAVAEPGSAKESIAAVAAIQAKQRGFNIPPKLAMKLAEARSNVEPVAKNGSNTDQRYSYVKAEDVVKEAGKALADAKVVVMPPEPMKIAVDDLRSNNNNSGKYVTVTFLVRVVDGETGEGYETERVGTATDYPGDKAIYKAETGMMKYFLSSLLQIPLGDGTDDPEATSHGGGGAVSHNDSSPASNPQKKLFKDLIAEKNLPRPAKLKILEYVGGDEPKKGAISHAIDQMMNSDPLEFAKTCGWDGTVDDEPPTGQTAEDAPAEQPDPEQDQQVATVPESEGKALIEFCREKGATKGELAIILRSVGTALPPDNELEDQMIHDSLLKAPIAQVARIKQMVTSAAESKQATAAAENSATEEATAGDGDGTTDEVDPKSPLGKAIERVSALGYKSEFGNLAWLLFDTDQTGELNEEQLNKLVATLERANKVGIQQAGVAACIRKAREGEHDVESRVERFESWIATKEQNAADTQAAEDAQAAAEDPQD